MPIRLSSTLTQATVEMPHIPLHAISQQSIMTDYSLRILLVDDSPTILKMSALMLRKLGHDVQSAENGAIAVKMVEERLKSNQKFDVILMDLQMPVMDGLEATQRIRHLEKLQAENNSHVISDSNRENTIALLPWRSFRHAIIGMSANSDHETATNAYEVGMDAFLAKPFKVDVFNTTLSKVLTKV